MGRTQGCTDQVQTLIKEFLREVCKVEEFHPMLNEFSAADTPKSLQRIEVFLMNGDELFKKVGSKGSRDTMIGDEVDCMHSADNITGTNFFEDGGAAELHGTRFYSNTAFAKWKRRQRIGHSGGGSY